MEVDIWGSTSRVGGQEATGYQDGAQKGMLCRRQSWGALRMLLAQDSQWSELENHLTVKTTGTWCQSRGPGQGPVSRPQRGAGDGVGGRSGSPILREDRAGDQVLGGKMVGSGLDRELGMPGRHPGRGGLRGLGDRMAP